jgi:hypothetical protein
MEYRWRFIFRLHHGNRNNNLGVRQPFCIWFWDKENNILVLVGFDIGIFFPAD